MRAGGHGYHGGDLTYDESDLPFGPGSAYPGREYVAAGSAPGPKGGSATQKSNVGGGSRWDVVVGNGLAGSDAPGSDRAGPFGTGSGDASGDQAPGSTSGPIGSEDAGFAGHGPGGNRPDSMGQSASAGSDVGSMGSGRGGSKGPSTTTQASQGSSPFSDTQRLANARGVDWALPDATVDAVGIKRPIRVICDAERLVLVPERGTPNQAQVFKHHGSLQAVIDPFVNSVRERLRGWGIAGRGIYWKPVLHVEVNDGANSNFAQLVGLLEDSGIQVTRQP